MSVHLIAATMYVGVIKCCKRNCISSTIKKNNKGSRDSLDLPKK